MPNLPISGLPASSTLDGSELFADVQGGITKYTTLDDIANYTTGSIGGVGGGGFGWARYDDTTYTTSSFFVVTASAAAVALPNNAGYTLDTYMNSTVDYYNSGTQKVQMAKAGDVYKRQMYNHMFNIFEEISWLQFQQLEHVKRLPLNEQVTQFNMYLQDLSIARLNWIQDQPKGPRQIGEIGVLLQEDLFDLEQENGSKILITGFI